MKIMFTVLFLLCCLGPANVVHVRSQEPLDGRNRIFRDELPDNPAGEWKLVRHKDKTGQWVIFAEDNLRKP